jgi:magnesium transporter
VRIEGTSDLFARRRPPPGSRPGAYVVPADAPAARIRALVYGADRVEERSVAGPEELVAAAEAPGVSWIEVEGLGDGAVLNWIRDALGVHPLAVADLANVGQRPKFEDYGDRDLLVAQRVELDPEAGCLLEQVSILAGPGFVVSVLERPCALFEPVRQRILNGALIRRMGSDFLVYALLDAVVDGFFPVVETIGDLLEVLEEEVVERPGRDLLGRLHAVRRTLLAVHRSMWRQRDALAQVMRHEGAPFSDEVRVYVRDAHDHALQVLDATETFREMAVSLMDVYLSSVSRRLNEVMKTLTVMATIFMPLTFIVGVYGMNFEHMPELAWRWGYPAVWGLVVAVSLGLLFWFRRRGWLEREAGDDEEEEEDADGSVGARAPRDDRTH